MISEPCRKDDQPLLAVMFVILTVLRLGLAVLRMKRRVNINRRKFRNELRRMGVPLNYARKLADEYGKEMSLHFWTRSLISGDQQFLSLMIKKRA